jgi:uncharacterized protein
MSYVFFIVLSLVLCISPSIYAGDINVDLIEAAAKGEITRVKNLLAKGADVNAREQQGRTALMEAAAKGQTASVEVLLAKGADIHARDQDGMTALMWAEKKGDSLIIQLLKKAGGKN